MLLAEVDALEGSMDLGDIADFAHNGLLEQEPSRVRVCISINFTKVNGLGIHNNFSLFVYFFLKLKPSNLHCLVNIFEMWVLMHL